MSQKKSEGSPAPSIASAAVGNRAGSRPLYELTLYATVPASRYEQLLHILTGVAGHPPNHVRERHMIFQPNRVPARQAAADQGGGSQTIQDNAKRKRLQESGRDGQTWLMRAVESVSETHEVAKAVEKGQDAHRDPSKWTWRWYGLPDPNMKTVTARSTEWNEMDTRDPIAFAESQGFRPSTQYGLEAQQFVYNNIVLMMHRLLKWQDGASSLEAKSFKDMSLVDGSGSYLLEARVMLADSTRNELIAKGTSELMQFRDMMQGCLDLRPADRLALDTRAR